MAISINAIDPKIIFPLVFTTTACAQYNRITKRMSGLRMMMNEHLNSIYSTGFGWKRNLHSIDTILHYMSLCRIANFGLVLEIELLSVKSRQVWPTCNFRSCPLLGATFKWWLKPCLGFNKRIWACLGMRIHALRWQRRAQSQRSRTTWCLEIGIKLAVMRLHHMVCQFCAFKYIQYKTPVAWNEI